MMDQPGVLTTNPDKLHRVESRTTTISNLMVLKRQRITLMCFPARKVKQMSKVRTVAVRRRRLWTWTMIMVETSISINQLFIEYSGMRGDRMAGDMQSDYDTRSEISGSTSRDQDDSIEVEPYDPAKLPPHACAYCGIHEPECVIKCGAKDCNKWFCNGKGMSSYGSHAILHMVKARHKEINLHPESPLKDTVIECYNCSSRNIFLLGFVSAK